MLNVNQADTYTDFNSLAKLKSEARKESPEALKEAAKQFEAIFLSSVLKTMREAKLADGIMDNDQSKFYGEMYDQQLAVHLSGSVGLADLVAKQMKKHEERDQTHEKLNLEDYLNRSSTAPKNISAANRATNSHAAGKKTDFVENIDPLNTIAERGIAESPLKNSRELPIQSAQDFVRHLHPLAEQAAKALGVEPKILLAQAALETNWGRSLIKNTDGSDSFNLFNVKANKTWQGKHNQVKTLEFDQGIAKKVNSEFRSYTSFEESFQDYVRFIKNNPRYGIALKQAANPERYVHELQRAGYATDPRYAEKVMSIYRSNKIAGFEAPTVVAMK